MTHYLQTRRTTIAQRIDHLMTEISLRIELCDETLTHPLMDKLLRHDVDRTILVQDVLSARKELFDGEHENIVAVIAKLQHCPLAEALSQASNLYESLMSAYDQSHTELLASPLGRQAEVRDFTHALNDFNAGLIEWASHSIRYTQTATTRWNSPDAIIATH